METARGLKLFNAVLFGLLMLPVAIIHHAVSGVLGALVVALGSVLLIAVAVWRMR